MSFLVYRRIFYYSLVFGLGVAVHQGFVADLVGSELGDLLRRNSEAYVMMWLPLYWDVFATGSDPDGLGGESMVGGRTLLRRQGIWFALLAAVAVLLQVAALRPDGAVLPNAIATLGEGFVALFFVSLYVGWSRGFLSPTVHTFRGSPVAGHRSRARYYGAVVVVALVAERAWIGGGIGDWLEINTEAYAAMLLIPTFFDLVAPSQKPVVRLVWYAGLALTPGAVQMGVVDAIFPAAVGAWLETTTEAFIATFAISVYFDLIRSSRHGWSLVAGKSPDSMAEESL